MKAYVQADTDMFDAHELRHIGGMPGDVVRRRRPGSEKARNTRHADHAAGCGARAYLFVSDVAPVLDECQRVGVAEDHRLRGGGHDLETAASTRVRAIHEHAR